ncbi:MAG: FAD-dependent oxidoreductase, partial [Clostridiales bacterium]|nr:FAD-dependent oxidoreductase [Clostridiales bacterium]
MKKILSLILCVALLAMGTTALAAAGTYTGVGDSQIGGAGSIEVSVTVDESGAVTAVEVTKNGDTPGISDPAVEQVPARIVELQTANVDGVSGATMTSQAISAAVLNAVEQAGLDVEAWNTKKEVVVEKAPDVEMTADVVIIGAGGAGLAAAVQANQNGASVIVLEKMGKVGGNTILAGGALNAVDDRSETAIKQNDSVEWH